MGVGLGASADSWWLIPAVAVLLLPLSELAVGLVNHLLTLLLPPRVLPKLAFKEGIPAEHATFIVIPGMLARASSAAVLVERLETHYLSNPDPSLRFALLTDFTDAPNETMPQDDELVRDALERIRTLNDRYREADDDRAGAEVDGKTNGDGQANGGPVAQPAARTGSFCSIAGGSGTRRRAAGWAGNGSAASCWSSTGCSAVPATRAIRCSAPTRRASRRSGTSSPWTPTPGCRATRPAAWSARWPTR